MFNKIIHGTFFSCYLLPNFKVALTEVGNYWIIGNIEILTNAQYTLFPNHYRGLLAKQR